MNEAAPNREVVLGSNRRRAQWSEARRRAVKSPQERLMAKVQMDPNGGCWLWAGGLVGGYGRLGVGPKSRQTHRLSYEAFVGPIPDGAMVCHRCDVPSCVNPDHLFLGSHQDNMNDMAAKGRGARALTPAMVREIRASTESSYQLAKRIPVSAGMIRRVRRGASWSQLK